MQKIRMIRHYYGAFLTSNPPIFFFFGGEVDFFLNNGR